MLDLLHHVRKENLYNLESWILQVLANFLYKNSNMGAVEWHRFDREFFRRGNTDSLMLQCIKELNNEVDPSGMPKCGSIQSFLEKYYADLKRKNLHFDGVECPQYPASEYVCWIRALPYFSDLVKEIIIEDEMRKGLTRSATLPATEIMNSVWDRIGSPAGASELSERMDDMSIPVTGRDFFWLLNPDYDIYLNPPKLLSSDLLKKVLLKIGWPEDHVRTAKILDNPLRFICVQMPVKDLLRFYLPALWHGVEIYWRPTTNKTTRWGHAVDFNEKDKGLYEEGYSEAIHPKINWRKSFTIMQLGTLNDNLVEMDNANWGEYLVFSLGYEVMKGYD